MLTGHTGGGRWKDEYKKRKEKETNTTAGRDHPHQCTHRYFYDYFFFFFAPCLPATPAYPCILSIMILSFSPLSLPTQRLRLCLS